MERNKPLLYPELFETVFGFVAQSGLPRAEIEEAILEQLRKLVAKNYAIEFPEEEVDIVIEKDPIAKTLDFYNIAGEQKKQVQFIRNRRDKDEFLGNVIANIDKIRSQREYDMFISQKGTLVSGIIEKTEIAGYVIDLGKFDGFRARGFLPKGECINNTLEHRRLVKGEKIMACILDVRPQDMLETRSIMSRQLDDCIPRMLLTRTKPEFLIELLKHHCYEIQDGAVEVKKVARYAGQKSKVAVYATDKNIDPVGACIGQYGARIRPIVEELSGERIDVIKWNDDLKTFISSVISPAPLLSYTLHPPRSPQDAPYAEISTTPDSKGKAISEVHAIYRMTGVRIHVTDAQQEGLFDAEYRINNLMHHLYVDRNFAETLASHGYSSVFAISSATAIELLTIEGLDEEVADALVQRATDAQEAELATLTERHNLSQGLVNFLADHNKLHIVYDLVMCNIKTVDDARQAYNQPDTEDITLLALQSDLADLFDKGHDVR
jgi:N utilization substance protein A